MGVLAEWNEASAAEAERRLLTCCGSRRWASVVAAGRPFANEEELLQAAEGLWFGLREEDWLEAFGCHPRIGERTAGSTAYLAQSSGEQAEAQRTLVAVAERMAEGNREYEERFGFRYIVFASGRSAPELLAVLERRLRSTREEELLEAARQQERITELRMRRWLEEEER